MLVSVRAMQVAKPVLHSKAPSCGSRAGGFLLGKLSDSAHAPLWGFNCEAYDKWGRAAIIV